MAHPAQAAERVDVPAFPDAAPCLVLACDVLADGGLKLSGYDVACGRAYRAVLRCDADGNWFVEDRLRFVGTGGPYEREAVEARGEAALLAWARLRQAEIAGVREAALREAQVRPRPVDESRLRKARVNRRHAEVQDRLALNLGGQLREKVARGLDGFPVAFEMTHRGVRYDVTVSEGEPLLRIEGGPDGTVAMGWDGTVASRGGPALPPPGLRSLALQTARRRPELLASMGLLLKARWAALSHRAEADRLDGAQPQATLPDRAGSLPIAPPRERIGWHAITPLTGERLQVCLHDLHGARQVHALVEPTDGVWSTLEAMSALSFRTARREELRDPVLADLIRHLGASHAGFPPPRHGPAPDPVEDEDGEDENGEDLSFVDGDPVGVPEPNRGDPVLVPQDDPRRLVAAATEAPASDPVAARPEPSPPVERPGTPDAAIVAAPDPTPRTSPADEPGDPLRESSDGDGPVPDPVTDPPTVRTVPVPDAIPSPPPPVAEAPSLPSSPIPPEPLGTPSQEAAAEWAQVEAEFEVDDPERDPGPADEPEFDAYLLDPGDLPDGDLAALDLAMAVRRVRPVPAPSPDDPKLQPLREMVSRADRLRDSGEAYPEFPYRQRMTSPVFQREMIVHVFLSPPMLVVESAAFPFEGEMVQPSCAYMLTGKFKRGNPTFLRMQAFSPAYGKWAETFRLETDQLARELAQSPIGIAAKGESARLSLVEIERLAADPR